MEFPNAYMRAIEKMAKNHKKKGDSWKDMTVAQLTRFLEGEIEEWNNSHNIDELLDIMNGCAMLHDRFEDLVQNSSITEEQVYQIIGENR